MPKVTDLSEGKEEEQSPLIEATLTPKSNGRQIDTQKIKPQSPVSNANKKNQSKKASLYLGSQRSSSVSIINMKPIASSEIAIRHKIKEL